MVRRERGCPLPELDGLARHVNSLAFFSIVDQDVGSHTEDDVHGQHG